MPDRTQRSEESLRLLVEQVREHAIFLIDPDGRVSSWNEGARRLYGYAEAEAVGLGMDRLFAPGERADDSAAIDLGEARATGVARSEHWMQRKDGSRFYAECTLTATHDDQGRLLGFVKVTHDLTQKRRIERLKESERHFRALADSTPVILWLASATGKLEWFNRYWRGFTHENAVEGWGPALHPDDVERCRRAWARAVRSGEPFHEELRFRRARDGRHEWFQAHAQPIRDEQGRILLWAGSATSIDLHKRALQRERILSEASMRLSRTLNPEATLQTVAEVAVPGLCDWCAAIVSDGRGQPDASRLAYRDEETRARVERFMEGFRRGRFPDSPIHQALATGEAILVTELGEREQAAYARTEERLELVRGLRLASFMAVPMESPTRGGVPGVLFFASSRPERRFGKEDLEMARDLAARAALALLNAHAYQESLDAIRSRDELFRMSSHELRTPVASLKLQLQLLDRSLERHAARTPLTELVRAKLGGAQHQVDRLTRLIDNLLEVARIRDRRFALSVEGGTDFRQLLLDAVARARREEELRRIPDAILLEVEPGEYAGDLDPTRMAHVLDNLLANAVKYGGGNPIAVRLAPLRERPGWVALEVRDQGVGLPAEDLDRVFNRFEQGVNTRRHTALGLGLYIARRIVEAHGGSIEATSRGEGQGATFRIELPLRPEARGAASRGTSAA